MPCLFEHWEPIKKKTKLIPCYQYQTISMELVDMVLRSFIAGVEAAFEQWRNDWRSDRHIEEFQDLLIRDFQHELERDKKR